MPITPDYSPFYYSPEELAQRVLQVYFKNSSPLLPIDPFQILEFFDVQYVFRDFQNLEGVYLVPDGDDDVALVGININRPTTRQRFTAAHELCHHIKDRNNEYCPLDGRKNKIERFADQFAAALLMPRIEFGDYSKRYLKDGSVSFEDVLLISDYFGVSFSSCIFRLAYDLHWISGDTSIAALQKRIVNFKPDRERIKLSLPKHDLDLLRNVVKSSCFFIQRDIPIVWNKFKNEFVYNENRLEGIPLEREIISEIVTDLRYSKQESEYCYSDYQTIIEVAGHSSLYDYILTTNEPLSIYGLLKLHQIMYQYCPFPEATGRFRDTNNLVLGGRFETSDCSQITTQIMELSPIVAGLVKNKKIMQITDFIESVVRIHHRLTVIHPFPDGNGRITRAFLNWLFAINNLPPVYIKTEKKEEYFEALSIADQTKNFDRLYEVFYREILRSMIDLHTNYI